MFRQLRPSPCVAILDDYLIVCDRTSLFEKVVVTKSDASLSLANELASFNSMADRALTSLDKTISNLRSKASAIASNVAILSVRLNFTSEYVDTLESGASKLTVADLNEEGANLLALQTRQQLGIQSLSFAGQSEQSILGLFR